MDEEVAIIPLELLRRLITYALTVCHSHCPDQRSGSTCPYLFRLSKAVGLGEPPCAPDYNGFDKQVLRVRLSGIARRYRVSTEAMVGMAARRSPRSLEEQVDYMEALFIAEALRTVQEEGFEVIIARRGDVDIRRELARVRVDGRG